MAEELDIAPPDEQQEPQVGQQNEPIGEPVLPDANKKELAKIIRGMEGDKIPADRISAVVKTYIKKYGKAPATPTVIPKEDYRQIPRQPAQQEGTAPAQQTAQRLDINQDPASVARSGGTAWGHGRSTTPTIRSTDRTALRMRNADVPGRAPSRVTTRRPSAHFPSVCPSRTIGPPDMRCCTGPGSDDRPTANARRSRPRRSRFTGAWRCASA